LYNFGYDKFDETPRATVKPFDFARFVETAKKLAEYGGLPNLEQAGDIWDDIGYVEAHMSSMTVAAVSDRSSESSKYQSKA
jgi:hypothetical protein